MRVALVSSRSFANVVPVGKDLLVDGGFEVRRVGPEERPLDEAKMVAIVTREKPQVIIIGAEPVTAEVLASSDKLRMIMKHGVGVDNIDLDAATSLGIVVANAPGTNTEAVADLVIGMMLELLRGIYAANQSTHAGGWDRFMGHDLGAQTIGVVGTGWVGSAVVRRLHGFGSTVLAYDIVENPDLEVRYVSLDVLLKESDIVTLHAPLTPTTRQMIGAAQLGLMKPSAILINAARGELVDEQALYAHLKTKRIAAAGIDVYSTEPPQESPLLTLANVLATPHIGAYTYEAMEAMDRLCAETIIGVLCENDRLPNLLNPEVVR
ncbi:phosphoglycerate dehydrogenase [Candidatus Bipolaricaulota bacterium]|nr:phosphoglycerate dehydrogenase [Candidatus Bipolaricaulota bacterium]